jgi:hypothetical protein
MAFVGMARAGSRGCALRSLWSLRPRMPGILGSRALWPSGTPRLTVARRGEVTSGHATRSRATTASRSRFHVDRHSVGVE